MRAAYWNVRGLGTPQKQIDVHNFVKYEAVDMMCIVENKLTAHKVERVMDFVFPGWKYDHNLSYCKIGDIWCVGIPMF